MVATKLNVKTPEGQDINVLPNYATCKCTGKSPLDMEMCPINTFDTSGYICVPELCQFYNE